MGEVSVASHAPADAPVVVQLGFVGSRRLYDREAHPEVVEEELHDAIAGLLVGRLARLPAELGLGPRHFLCGISSLAAGADALFAQACERGSIPLRVFLPQQREDFLSAVGREGPDFTETERSLARALLARPHVIQERVVGRSLDRDERFEDVNLEIVRVSDLLVCLLAESARESSVTADAIAAATGRGRPVLVVSVGVEDGLPTWSEEWLGGRFEVPRLPSELRELAIPEGLPEARDYAAAVKELAEALASRHRRRFTRAAQWIIGTHVAATAIAVSVLAFHWTPLLWLELALLIAGFVYHQLLHRGHSARAWALARLVSEMARSALSIRPHVQLAHLFDLSLPQALRPLSRTMNVLHLRGTRDADRASWREARDAYVRERLEGPDGQLEYYRGKCAHAERWLRIAHRTFLGASACAILATALKLATGGAAAAALGSLAVLLPVAAVAALSLAASHDLEARAHTYADMHRFVGARIALLRSARSSRELEALLLETESRLLGEVASWYSRRSFTGVA